VESQFRGGASAKIESPQAANLHLQRSLPLPFDEKQYWLCPPNTQSFYNPYNPNPERQSTAKMGYTQDDWQAINTIRLLAVCLNPAIRLA
jgi:hypothetical protein